MRMTKKFKTLTPGNNVIKVRNVIKGVCVISDVNAIKMLYYVTDIKA